MIERMYQAYKADLYRYLLKLCRDEGLAEELLSETFYQAILSLPSYKKKSNEKTWLCAIARHVYLRYIEKNKKYVPMNEVAYAVEMPIEDDFWIRRIHELMEQRDERSRLLFVYKCQGYSSVEIAGLMGLSDSSVRVLDYRNRQFLRMKLEEEGYHEAM